MNGFSFDNNNNNKDLWHTHGEREITKLIRNNCLVSYRIHTHTHVLVFYDTGFQSEKKHYEYGTRT